MHLLPVSDVFSFPDTVKCCLITASVYALTNDSDPKGIFMIQEIQHRVKVYVQPDTK